uniref:Phospholipid-transporting ATPase n=1 Tax=Salmo trutta TaxID=8032 RepID=A0A673XF46_SALTR
RANDRELNLSYKYAVSTGVDYSFQTNVYTMCVCVYMLYDNAIKTSKYNVFTFLPLNLFEQFQRLANAYFLFLLCLQSIPEVSSLPWYTTVVPLVLVLSMTMAKDCSDDMVSSTSTNYSIKTACRRWSLSLFLSFSFSLSLLLLCLSLLLQADLLLLSSSEPLNLVYIETAELDGCVSVCCMCLCLPFTPVTFHSEVRCEPPNNRLDKFTGTLTLKGETYSLDNERILLRGCTLRNTQWCFGLVVFGGPDTKLMQNCGRTTFKRTSIDRLMNVLVLSIFGFLMIMCLILAIGNGIWEYQEGSKFAAFLPKGVSAPFSAFLTFWSYVIILNTVVPISLYVSVEIIRLGNSFYINWDRKMYYPKSDTPAEARTTTLNEELGQIKYIFSDKTGTLTQNIMTFNKCSINGKSYGEAWQKVDFSWNNLADPKFCFHDNSLVEVVRAGNPEVQAFFRLLALCHTVMPEEKKEGEQLYYQAQSPDEGALVTAARNFGFVFRSRTPESITVVEMGELVTYELLAVLDFNNVRKRMSVIVRSPEGKLTLYCKGADTIIFERLSPSCSNLTEVTTEHLNEFAGEGLRTLALAYKDIDPEYMEDWKLRHHVANTAMDEREEKLDALYEEIEKGLLLLGSTAVEDKLQDGVPQTIEQLSKADIKIWVLTGDKQETAENIGYSCNMLREEMNEVFIVSANTAEEVRKELQTCSNTSGIVPIFHEQSFITFLLPIPSHLTFPPPSLSTQAFALEKDMEMELLRTACMCQTVICCRVTPLQKAQVVELVKKYKQAVTLAIGDGANDVSMIKAAHIGVGISGQEGMQAVLSSDYSFAQFRYLQRLLLVHGRWSYLRMCKFLRYFFYKNFTFTFVHFWYGFFCGFSAQTAYDDWFITLFNLVYTALPVLSLSLFDQDVNDWWSFQYPQLYTPGQLNQYFSKRAFVYTVLHSVYSSLVLFFIPWAAMYDTVRDDGKDIVDYQSFALLAQTCLLIAVSIQLGLDTHYWTAMNQFFLWGSLSVYFAVIFTMYSNGMFLTLTSSFPFIGTARNSLNQPNVWLTMLLTSILCVLPVVAYRFLRILLWPTINDKVRYKVRQDKVLPPTPRRVQARRTSTRRSGYAFSHAQGYGDLVTSGKFLRRTPKRRPALFSQTDSPLAQTQPQFYRTISEREEPPLSP